MLNPTLVVSGRTFKTEEPCTAIVFEGLTTESKAMNPRIPRIRTVAAIIRVILTDFSIFAFSFYLHIIFDLFFEKKIIAVTNNRKIKPTKNTFELLGDEVV